MAKKHSQETRKRLSEAAKRHYDKHPETRMQISHTLRGKRKKPNKQETRVLNFLNRKYPNCWCWNGGWLTFEGKIPDFIHEPSKLKIIEFFGNYWHKLEEEEEKIKFYAKFGYKAFIIWETELENASGMVERLDKFMQEE